MSHHHRIPPPTARLRDTDVIEALVELDPTQHADRFTTVQEQLVRNYHNFSLERADTHASFALRLFLETGAS